MDAVFARNSVLIDIVAHFCILLIGCGRIYEYNATLYRIDDALYGGYIEVQGFDIARSLAKLKWMGRCLKSPMVA